MCFNLGNDKKKPLVSWFWRDEIEGIAGRDKGKTYKAHRGARFHFDKKGGSVSIAGDLLKFLRP